ncbi:hypothetical protein E9840_11265 [Tissierella creatinini]|nr:hypothetical protein E9840_11265 [Tissierella creatinini]TJX62914.1 hypothetical protein E8P77_16320 [Soehngenia saccharolytica]
MAVRTALLKVIFKNWRLINSVLDFIPKSSRKRVIKLMVEIIIKNKLPFTYDNFKKVADYIKEKINSNILSPVDNQVNGLTIESIDTADLGSYLRTIDNSSLITSKEEDFELIEIVDYDENINFEDYLDEKSNGDFKFKIIFLSGEGVIFKSKAGNIDRLTFIEPSFVALKKIIEETGASIIITSSVRKSKGGKMLLEMKFKEYGIDKSLIGYTVETVGKRRKDKIKEKIKDFNDAIDNYVIFDRRTDLGKTLSTALIPCSNGIDRTRMQKSIEILNK